MFCAQAWGSLQAWRLTRARALRAAHSGATTARDATDECVALQLRTAPAAPARTPPPSCPAHGTAVCTRTSKQRTAGKEKANAPEDREGATCCFGAGDCCLPSDLAGLGAEEDSSFFGADTFFTPAASSAVKFLKAATSS